MSGVATGVDGLSRGDIAPGCGLMAAGLNVGWLNDGLMGETAGGTLYVEHTGETMELGARLAWGGWAASV